MVAKDAGRLLIPKRIGQLRCKTDSKLEVKYSLQIRFRIKESGTFLIFSEWMPYYFKFDDLDNNVSQASTSTHHLDVTAPKFSDLKILLANFDPYTFMALTTNCHIDDLRRLAKFLPRSVENLRYIAEKDFNEREFLSALKKMSIRRLHLEKMKSVSASFFNHDVIRHLSHLSIVGEDDASVSLESIMQIDWLEAYFVPTTVDKEGASKIIKAWIEGEKHKIERFAITMPTMKMKDIMNALKKDGVKLKLKTKENFKDNCESMKIKRKDGASLYVTLLRADENSKTMLFTLSSKKLFIDETMFEPKNISTEYNF